MIRELSPEEYADFRSMSAVMDRHTWERYANEITPGCHVADFAFLDKIRARYGISSPTGEVQPLFLLGRQDTSMGYADALRLLELYPRGTFAFVDRAGHNLQI